MTIQELFNRCHVLVTHYPKRTCKLPMGYPKDQPKVLGKKINAKKMLHASHFLAYNLLTHCCHADYMPHYFPPPLDRTTHSAINAFTCWRQRKLSDLLLLGRLRMISARNSNAYST